MADERRLVACLNSGRGGLAASRALERVSRLPEDADQVLISVNPKAGSGPGQGKVGRLTDRLRADGLRVRIIQDLAEVAVEAEQLYGEGRLRALVAAGGDGTAAEIVNRTGPGIPITVLPLGTANLLARHVGLSGDPDTVADAIRDGTLLRLDAGRAGQRVFLLMATCGIDADIVQRLHDRRGGHIRRSSYVKPTLSSFLRYQHHPLRLYFTVADQQGASETEQTQEIERAETVRWASLFNLPCYGAGFKFTPDADGADGLLDLCSYRRGSLLHDLRFLAHVVVGRHQRLTDCVCAQVKRLRIEADVPVPYQLDGDPGGHLPCEFEVLPGRLTLVVPAGSVPLADRT